MTRILSLMLLAVMFALGTAACEREGPAERAGEDIGEAAEETGEAIDEGMEEAEDELED
jgi:hypothetical protein